MFETIENSLSDNMISSSKVLTFTHNQVIIRSEESLQYLYYILEGRAKIYLYTENGKEIFIHFLKKDDWIGELAFLGVEGETKNVVAVGDTKVLAIPKDVVTSQLLTDSQFLLEMGRFIGKKLLDRTNHFVKIQGYELKYRLATLLIDMSHDGIYSEKHTNVVDYLGTSYRHLLQIMQEFQKSGFIRKIGTSTYEIDEKRLKKYYIT
ncbi:TPA: cyclic nucleotide-binding domain-containing protein [Streptococcus suis]